jgi:hypothetical protein
LRPVVEVLGDILLSAVLAGARLLEMAVLAAVAAVAVAPEVAAQKLPAVVEELVYMVRAITAPADLRPDVREVVEEVMELTDKIILP